MDSLCHPLILLIEEAGTVVCFSLEAAQNKNPKKSRILNQDERRLKFLPCLCTVETDDIHDKKQDAITCSV